MLLQTQDETCLICEENYISLTIYDSYMNSSGDFRYCMKQMIGMQNMYILCQYSLSQICKLLKFHSNAGMD